MPIGKKKNMLYGMMLPLLGKRCEWKGADDAALDRILRRHRVVGACIQRFEKGRLTQCHAVGHAALEGARKPAAPDTLFRTASVAKMVSALLAFRLQTLGKLNVDEDISAFWDEPIRNPMYPDTPVTLGMLLSHTSSIVDSEAYFNALTAKTPLKTILTHPDAFSQSVPGSAFRYSNLAAGMVACLLENRFGMSFEALAQQELFGPLGIQASFDIHSMDLPRVADSYRVLPFRHAFDAKDRAASAEAADQPDPQHHYMLASGNLFITAPDLARLTLLAWNGGEGFLDEKCLYAMHTPLKGWPEPEVNMRHGVGLLMIDDHQICLRKIWGHQGFAYGAVNGVFFDEEGSGFVCLNSGASEQRMGHLALLNRDLIHLWMNE